MLVKHLNEIEFSEINLPGVKNVKKQIAISSEDGTPEYSLRVFTIEPDGNTPYHNHPYEHLNYIIGGEGFLVDNEGKEHRIRKGDFALIQPNENHQFVNKAKSGNLILICAVKKEFE